eukprot:1740117-Amphidinium_carterae.3
MYVALPHICHVPSVPSPVGVPHLVHFSLHFTTHSLKNLKLTRIKRSTAVALKTEERIHSPPPHCLLIVDHPTPFGLMFTYLPSCIERMRCRTAVKLPLRLLAVGVAAHASSPSHSSSYAFN